MMIGKRLLNILFWSVISAAFIGPGTITTAASAGSRFGFSLVWTLVFSTIACLVLQEAAARLTIVSGKNLGESIATRFGGSLQGNAILWFAAGSILLGSAAFEAGNILGAMAGIELLSSLPNWIFVCLITSLAALALSIPSLRILSRLMGILVAIMGIAFLTTAVMIKPDPVSLIRGSLVPVIPNEQVSGLLILGLIGTTVVPYNLFLGSGISSSRQSIRDMRIGLSVAIVLGGLISISVLVVGTSLGGDFGFGSLAASLSDRLGAWAGILFSLGLFAAGFSSAVTAPLASAITLSSVFGKKENTKWGTKSLRYRATWGMVVLTGFVFGISGTPPVPVILAAQALNGLILPFISVFLLLVVNDPSLYRGTRGNGLAGRLLLGTVVWFALLLGIAQFLRVILPPSYWLGVTGKYLIAGVILIACLISFLAWRQVYLMWNKKL